MQANPQTNMEMTPRLLNTKEEHLKKVVLVVANYLVEGEYWLQNTSSMLELLFPHHIYIDKIVNRTSRRYT